MMQSDMTSRLVALCFGANDPLRLARFWAEALHWEVGDEADDEIGLVPTDGTRFRIVFSAIPEQKAGKNRIHLDLTSTSIDDQRETVERLVELGGSPHRRRPGPGRRSRRARRPEGNELCIIEPGNTFLAGCGRLGSITCDGTREVGYFWSDALGWPLVWDQDDETAIRAPDGTGPFITWGPPVAPKLGRNRLHLDIAPSDDVDQRAEVDRLVALGATRIDTVQGEDDLGGHGRSRRERVLCADPRIARKREEWDSNPRMSCLINGFQDRRLRPLGHPPGRSVVARPAAGGSTLQG